MVSSLKKEVDSLLDPFQFAYKQGRGTDDSINSITHLVTEHPEDPKAYVRLLFVDFSSAFNMLQPHLLIEKLKNMNVNPFILKWFMSFLTNRVQYVRVNNVLSESRLSSTGAPQGCVSSPVLFTLYTNDCIKVHPDNYIIKFSDDTAILGLLHKDGSPVAYHSEICKFVQWCDSNYLMLNVKKTKEMVFNIKAVDDLRTVVIHNEPIAQVSSYRYLGVYIDDTLSWRAHVESLCSKLQQRLYFLR